MCRGSAADPGSTPGLSLPLSLTLFSVTLFSCTVNKARKVKKKKTVTISDGPLYKIPLSLISVCFVTLLCPFLVSLCRQSQIQAPALSYIPLAQFQVCQRK